MIERFFSYEPGVALPMFGVWHIAALSLFLGICIMMWIFREPLRRLPPKYDRALRWSVAAGSLILEISFKFWLAAHQKFSISEILNLELCYLTLIISSIACLFEHERLFEISWFWWFGGILSLLFPIMGEHTYGPDRFRYYHYFLIHASFIWMNLYLLWIQRFRISLRTLQRSLSVLMMVVIIASVVNRVWGSNFMFLREPPFSFGLVDIVYARSPMLYAGVFVVFMALFMLVVTTLPIMVMERREVQTDQREEIESSF